MATGCFRFEGFELDPGNRRLSRDGAPVELNARYLDALVLLAGSGGQKWRTAVERASLNLGVPVEAYLVGTGPDHDLAPDPDADWAELHGTAEDGAVLVRPDGFVAWRADGVLGEQADLAARRHWHTHCWRIG